MQALSDDAGVVRTLGWRPADAYALATMAQDERGFFWFLAISCRDYLCESRELREQVDRQVTAMRRAGQGLLHVTPEFLVASGGLKLASVLVASVPALGAMGVPLIGGLVFVMYSVGTDAFCAWTREHQHYHANFPNADGNV